MENVIYNELRMRGYNVDVGVVPIVEKDSNGKPLLLQTSTNICAYGGLIKATFSGALRRVTNGS